LRDTRQPPPDGEIRSSVIRQVLRWYRKAGRQLPWRGSRDAYRILLSEVMLQQTGVGRVLEKYPEFLRRFPTIGALARAKRRDVVVAWRGMGYNNRAVRLHLLAGIVVKELRGKLPSTEEALVALPGIGKYTARALLSSVHGQPAAVVDVNVRRFYSRLFFRMKTEDMVSSEAKAWTIADRMMPARRSYDWNQALMDVGATVCTARRPRCGICPVAAACRSREGMKPSRPEPRRPEPGLHGVPNRIYRGRIIEALRSGGTGKTWRMDDIGRMILPDCRHDHTAWLRDVVRTLESDGLVLLRNPRRAGSIRIALA
jgi:A/G-specific adenine glycosylase